MIETSAALFDNGFKGMTFTGKQAMDIRLSGQSALLPRHPGRRWYAMIFAAVFLIVVGWLLIRLGRRPVTQRPVPSVVVVPIEVVVQLPAPEPTDFEQWSEEMRLT